MKKLLLSVAAAAVVLPAGSALAVQGQEFVGDNTKPATFQEADGATTKALAEQGVKKTVDAAKKGDTKRSGEKVVVDKGMEKAPAAKPMAKKALPKTSAVK